MDTGRKNKGGIMKIFKKKSTNKKILDIVFTKCPICGDEIKVTIFEERKK